HKVVHGRFGVFGLKSNFVSGPPIDRRLANQREIEPGNQFRCQNVLPISRLASQGKYVYFKYSMKLVGSAKSRFGLALLLALSGLGTQVLYAATAMSADEVVRKAVQRAQRSKAESFQPAYTYTKVTVTEE